MKTQLSFAPLAEIETELLAVLAADTQTSKEPDAKPQPVLLTADAAVQAAAAAVLASGEYKAGANETLLLHAPAGLPQSGCCSSAWASRPRSRCNTVRNAAGAAVRFAKPRGIRELVFALPDIGNCWPPRPVRSRRRRGRLCGRLRPRHLSQRPQGPERGVLHSGRARRCRQGRAGSRLRRGRHHGREPELHPLAGQRAGQQAHPHHPRPARRADGRRSRPRLGGPLHRKAARAEDGRILERLAGLGRAARADRPAL